MSKDGVISWLGFSLKVGVHLEQRDHCLKMQKRPKHFELHALFLSFLRLWDNLPGQVAHDLEGLVSLPVSECLVSALPPLSLSIKTLPRTCFCNGCSSAPALLILDQLGEIGC